MLKMPKASDYHDLGWAIDHVMSAPNVRARTQEDIAEVATRGGYKADRRLVGTYMRPWPESDPQGRAGQPRSRPPFGFIWALIRGGKLTKEQAQYLTDEWLKIRDEDEREDLQRLCAILSADDASTEAWQDMLDLEAAGDDFADEEGEHVRHSEGDQEN